MSYISKFDDLDNVGFTKHTMDDTIECIECFERHRFHAVEATPARVQMVSTIDYLYILALDTYNA